MNLKTKYVFLGRFSPLHKGHQMIIDKMISEFGIENCLIIVGSTNILDNRTPFTYSLRKKIIKIIYPKLKVLGIKDVFNDDLWIKILKKIEKKLNSKFVFLGGSKTDLEVLSTGFKTMVFVSRYDAGRNICGTKVRKNLKNIDLKVKNLIVDALDNTSLKL